MVEPIPPELEGHVVPYLIVDGAAAAIDFYQRAFGAEERVRMPMPNGTIGHAELVIGGAPVYLADPPEPQPGYPKSPKELGGTPVMLMRYVPDVDVVVEEAQRAGAAVLRPPQDEFYGDRTAVIEDPFGHLWSIHTHMRDVSPEEMEQAMAEMSSGGCSSAGVNDRRRARSGRRRRPA